MGQRGPSPKPTALKQLEGTYRPDRAQGEIFPDSPQSILPPDHLSEPAPLYRRKCFLSALWFALPILATFAVAFVGAALLGAEYPF